MKTALKAQNIQKYFYEPTEFHVLKNISLTIQQGEFVSLIGKSGCGKSTLLYLLSTMDTNYEGELYMNDILLTGKKQNELAEFRNKHIGFIFQFHFLLPEFSVLKNIMIPALKLGLLSQEEIEHNAIEKLRILGVAEQALKPANKLSGGQQQRVAIARALINNPTIIMGDEPTGNLDSKNTDIVFNVLREISQELGQSIITVTHDHDFSKKCDRIIEMSDGEILSH